jgi:hypothetical protein
VTAGCPHPGCVSPSPALEPDSVAPSGGARPRVIRTGTSGWGTGVAAYLAQSSPFYLASLARLG